MSDHNQAHTNNEVHAHTGHSHTHGAVEPSLFDSQRGIRAVQLSLLGLLGTALLQVVIVAFTGSVALLADTIHNFGDGLTAIPLWVAFVLSRRKPSQRYTYGLGRVEDLAGLFILLMILISAVVAGVESVRRFIDPHAIRHVWAVALAGVIGFLGNEAVALYRLRVGREIGSAALVADGYHARVDGLTSLAVLAGVAGVWLGFPLADPLVGIGITLAIVRILWQAAGSIFSRLLDGVDPEVVEEIRLAIQNTDGVKQVNEVRVRWLGHRLLAEINLAVDPLLSVAEGHTIATQAGQNLREKLRYLSWATIHVDPLDRAGEKHHFE